MKNRRKMGQDIWPMYSPRYAPKMTLAISLFFLILMCAVGLYMYMAQADKAPIKIYKPVEVSNTATPKPPPPGETAESGHWHGDEWHAERHEPVVEADAPLERFIDAKLAAYEASLSHYTEEERATYNRALRGEIIRHREKYPNCQDDEAVFEDADRFSRWYVSDKAYRKIVAAARAEWEVLVQNPILPTNYHELVQLRDTLSDAEKTALIERSNNWRKSLDAASKRYNEVSLNQKK